MFLPLGDLTWGRGIDLAWADETKLVASSSFCGSPPTKNNLQPTPLTLTPGQLKSNHQSLYVHFECTDKSKEGNSNVSNDKSQESTLCSIATALMNKQNHFPSHKTDNCGKKNIQQYNMSVQGVYLTEYVDAIQTFSDILWEIDPRYQKLVTRRNLFPDAIVDNFVGFNDPKLHGHAVKPFNKNSLSLKITKLLALSDRKFMRQQHTKPFVDIDIDIDIDIFLILIRFTIKRFYPWVPNCWGIGA